MDLKVRSSWDLSADSIFKSTIIETGSQIVNTSVVQIKIPLKVIFGDQLLNSHEVTVGFKTVEHYWEIKG